ncbi:MAG: DUF1211 domain-containing protein [Bacteroidales bacterium]|nr:DUF1211 domain-containing protein [Bacteroidales bacterium]
MTMQNQTISPVDPVHRLLRITDIIFALSMVMFVLTGTMTMNDANFWVGYDSDPARFVLGQARELLTAFLVFLFIAIYWATHINQAKYIIKVDGPYIWINLLYLFFIVIAPLPNALSLKFGSDFYVQQFFNLNMLLIGLFGFLAWYYATKKHRLVDKELSPSQIRSTNREMVVEPLVALIAIVVSFTIPQLWELSLLLLPLVIIIVGIVNRKKTETST